MKTFKKWLLIIVLVATAAAYAYVYVRDTKPVAPEVITETIIVKDNTFETEYGEATNCFTTNDNFLICKLGE